MLFIRNIRSGKSVKTSAALILFVVFSLNTPHALASLIEVDFLTSGDGAVTRDTRTGLEWLDLSLTDGWSVNNALSSEFATRFGYRLANAMEVDSLLESAGLSRDLFNADQASAENVTWVSAFSPPGNNIEARSAYTALSPLLGFTAAFSQFGIFQRGVNGVFSNSFTAQGLGINTNEVSAFRGVSSYSLRFDVAGTGMTFADSNDDYGVYLVRNAAAVSAPGTAGLVLIALIIRARRFQKGSTR